MIVKLPTDPAKLKLLSREYILKHCRALEKEADTFKKQLEDWLELHKSDYCATCGVTTYKTVKKLLVSTERAE